jgi:hypothetical protein
MNLAIQNPERFKYYLPLCLLIAAIVVTGFAPSYVGAMMDGVATPLVIHFHAIVFSGWLVLFTTQALLPAFGRVDLHRKLGKFGIGYGIFLIFVGLYTALNRYAFKLDAGHGLAAKAELIMPLTDMVVFPIFFAVAIAYRHKPEIHKRLMLVATVMLTIAAVARMGIVGDPPNLALMLAIWLSPIYLSMAYDFYRHRLVHPAYVIGLVSLTIVIAWRGAVMESDGWIAIADWIALQL